MAKDRLRIPKASKGSQPHSPSLIGEKVNTLRDVALLGGIGWGVEKDERRNDL